MKLISLFTLITTVSCQKVQQEQFPFPPQFQTPTSAIFSSDSSIYLPPESHTPIPYYALNNMNKLPFPFLPPTGTKVPSLFSTPFPLMVSSTFKSNMDDEDKRNREEMNNRRIVIMKPPQQNNINNTSGQRQLFDKRESKPNVRVPSSQTPIVDFQSNYATLKNPIQNSAARRMIITSEIQRSDSGPDQLKSPSFQSSQFVHAPGVFISSSTEPSIPILRLSNEMDLDGSFSYEALGADQTHYVQHSRMENMGTDKEEQVVEGSYSYVGDDGRTYTVHYIADSNGYRATGDHLPVPPPVPEIIQRAVQYNLAEEAKKPPNLKSSWDSDENEYREESREESRHRFFNIPPPRNLFTGKTPEAFSFGFSQGNTNSQNNLATAASFQVPTKTNFDITVDQSQQKLSVTPISPQITFLASQGARNPSLQPQTSQTKIINSEKSMPSLMHYEADKNESDDEANKALWRWQYGLNSNLTPNKNSISRSSSEGDDIVINFSDMTPEQYTSMIQSQILGRNIEKSTNNDEIQSSTYFSNNMDTYNNEVKVHEMDTKTEKYDFLTSTEKNDLYAKSTEHNTDLRSKIISSQNFIPHSQIATQSYNVEVSSYEPTEINVFNENYTKNLNPVYNTGYSNNVIYDNIQERSTTIEPIFNNIDITKDTEFKRDDKDSFKPILYNNDKDLHTLETETAVPPMQEKIRENIFLKHLFESSQDKDKSYKQENVDKSHKEQDVENRELDNPILDTKVEKIPKYIDFQQKPQNEIKIMPPKPLDMNDILNYVVMKNHFESIKTRPKSKPNNHFNQNSNAIMREPSLHYIPLKENNDEDRENNKKEQDNNYRPLNQQQQQELRGLIKNYKVLQRNKNLSQKNQPIPEPQRHIKTFHTQSLPPLGRAGPSLKSYLPPTHI